MALCPIPSHRKVFELTERREKGHYSAPVSVRYLGADLGEGGQVGRWTTPWGFRHDDLPLPTIRFSHKGDVSLECALTESVRSLVCVK